MERVDEEADKIIIDKIAGEAANDNTAGERVEELAVDPSVELAVLEAAERVDEIFVDPSIEAILEAAELAVDPFVGLAVLEAVDRVDEEADEDIIDKIARSEAVLDKIAGGEAVHDKIARDEAVHDNTAGERVEEFTVDPSIEAILEAAERIDEEVKGPGFESSPQ